ncbi:MAG: metallophosphoesterase [Nanoarchaeales archaeon]|nr:metallophosphoesterase [Nanoarchaeales archaeon]
MSEFSKIVDKKGIDVISEVKFENTDIEIAFLNKFDVILGKGVEINFLNQDLVDIFMAVEINEYNVDYLKKTNWTDLREHFENHTTNKRSIRIYNDFLEYLKKEIGIISKLDSDIYSKRDDFNISEDLSDKLSKFGVELEFDYTEPPKKITVNDFTLFFNRRLEYFTKLLRARASIDIDTVMRISQLKDFFETNTSVTIIGLISDIKETKNGHYMISIEDKSGEIKCFVNKDKKEMINKIQNFCLDEGIGVRGKIGKNIIWTDEFIIPSPPNNMELRATDKEEYVVTLSDIHFGAKVFVDDAFQKFLEFINGRSSNDALNRIANKVKHIIIPGDIIEGIGIYPNQGKDARILSTELQYHEAARWLSKIPSDKAIIIIPGNHDTSRLSEPQPKLPYEKAYALYHMPNVINLSNPSIVRLFSDDPSGGLRFYLYHGGSFFYYGDKIQKLRDKGGMKVPNEIVKFLLEKRHLAPSHGSTLYIPDNQKDPLVIEKMPDFFITGHTHKLDVSNYKGCTIVSCGCWVEMSDYQEKMGMYPDIGKCILLNMKTRMPKVLNFYSGDNKVVKRDSAE